MLKEYGLATPEGRVLQKRIPLTQEQTGLDIVDSPDENDLRALREVEAFAATDRFIKSTEQATETALRMREENINAVKQYRWEKQQELAREGERIGKIISEGELLDKLRNICVCKYNDWSARGMRGLSVLKDNRWQYVCAVQCGYMPEYSVCRFDDYGLPVNEKYRGWRTVLLRLITQDFISETDAHRVFGAAPVGGASRRYREELVKYRHRKEKENEKNGGRKQS